MPPRATYSLTDLGVGLAAPLCGLIHWLGEHADDVRTAQARYDTGRR